MIAGREEVDAGGKHLLGGLMRQTEPAGGVLAVGDDDVDVMLFADEREMFGERLATGRADDVGDRKDGYGGF